MPARHALQRSRPASGRRSDAEVDGPTAGPRPTAAARPRTARTIQTVTAGSGSPQRRWLGTTRHPCRSAAARRADTRNPTRWPAGRAPAEPRAADPSPDPISGRQPSTMEVLRAAASSAFARPTSTKRPRASSATASRISAKGSPAEAETSQHTPVTSSATASGSVPARQGSDPPAYRLRLQRAAACSRAASSGWPECSSATAVSAAERSRPDLSSSARLAGTSSPASPATAEAAVLGRVRRRDVGSERPASRRRPQSVRSAAETRNRCRS